MSVLQFAKKIITNGFARLGYDISRQTAFGKNAILDIQLFVPQPSVLFDVGANEGQTALLFESLFPSAEIVSFEPSVETYKKLCAAVGRSSKIRTEPLALGDTIATAILYENTNSFTNSLLPNAPNSDKFQPEGFAVPKAQTQVRVTTLDAYTKDAGILRVDLLKIDAQGYEFRILQGASLSLEQHLFKAVFLEVSFVPLYDGQASFSEIFNLLITNGYCLIGLYGLHRSAKGKLLWCDALFVAEEFTHER
jgi:FkbM family methyltransferase